MYVNPVYPESCPDPFILKHCGEYWCYSTGWAPDGKVIPILHSKDLIHWQGMGGAMEALPGGSPEYWAPEVSYSDGRFYMYYSVGDGIQMKLRVAIAWNPGGPFSDSGRVLSREDFAIDAHVFEDDDGSRYLFYATDFLEHTHIGTGIVADRMLDPLTLEGRPRRIALPHFDWQVYDANRIEKGGVRWHTVEGPFVLKHKGRYYQMFSGGNWRNVTYGVSYALADSIDSQQEWTQLEHDENVPLVLATIPGRVIGPGHNSVIRGPDNRQLYCMYHRWAPDESARLLSLDRLEWIGDRLSVLGPSMTPQDNPNAPQHPILHHLSGLWDESDNELTQFLPDGSAQSEAELDSDYFIMEVSLAALPVNPGLDAKSEVGLRLFAGQRKLFEAAVNPARSVVDTRGESITGGFLPFSPDFPFSSYHLLRIEVNGRELVLQLDGRTRWQGRIQAAPNRLALFSEKIACSFKGCSITYGFEDTFFADGGDPDRLGWHLYSTGPSKWQLSSGELQQIDPNALNSVLVKEHPFRQYELVINTRLLEGDHRDSYYGFYPALTETGEGPLIRIEKRKDRTHLAWYSQQGYGAWELPDGFDRFRAQQFRFRNQNGQLLVYRESEALGTIAVPDRSARVALYANKARVSFDLVRLTLLNQAVERS